MGLGSAGSYRGTAEQNTRLLQALQSRDSQPAPAPAQAPAAAPAGGSIAQQFVDSLLSGNKVKPYEEVAGVFTWGANEEKAALDYAESVYGKYFADLLKDYVDKANVSKTRLDEDAQFELTNLQNNLNDYLGQDQTSRQRLEQDYTTAMQDEARKLGIDLEAIDTAKSRETEDTDRTLAEYQEDYERTGGRISEDKIKYIQENDQTIKNRGLTFSGQRVKETGTIEDQAKRQLDDLKTGYTRSTEGTQRSYSRNLADLNRQAKIRTEEAQLNEERLGLSKTRTTEDMDTNKNIVQRDFGINTNRQGVLKSRSVYDIEQALKEQQDALDLEKQTQKETGYYGVESQRARKVEDYDRRSANYYTAQRIGGL